MAWGLVGSHAWGECSLVQEGVDRLDRGQHWTHVGADPALPSAGPTQSKVMRGEEKAELEEPLLKLVIRIN